MRLCGARHSSLKRRRSNAAASHLGEGTNQRTVLACLMPRYFFDTRDNDTLTPDTEGVVLSNVAAAKATAAASLAEVARDVLPSSDRHRLAVEVREGHEPILVVSMMFEAVLLAT